MEYAYWRKCDFQVHTPRDPNWSGVRPIGLGEQLNNNKLADKGDVDQARTQWANEFVDTCLAKGLKVVAITDHHETVMYHHVAKVITYRKIDDPSFNLWAFPGMELTALSGVQCLIIFDFGITSKWIMQAQGKLGIEFAELDEYAAKSPKVTQLTCNYADIGTLLDELEPLRGHYIVLPNVSQGNNHTVLKKGCHIDFRRMPYMGGYVDAGQNIDTLSAKNKSRISGLNNIWSTREIYPLPTSDSRSASYEALGTNNTWIKLAEPTAEAIKQAFLGHKSRISISEPNTPSLRISEVEIAGSTILENSVTKLSSELNSVIGGRGSGKSSFLEYLAFGLGRSCYDVHREHYSGSSRMVDLVKDTFITKGGDIRVSFIQDGAQFIIKRGQDTAYNPQITYPNGIIQTLSTKELRSLFPAVIYSQGELSEIGKQSGKKTQLADLLQFVNSDYKKEDDQLQLDIQSTQIEVRENLQKLVNFWIEKSNLKTLTTNKDSMVQRVNALEKTLPQLSEEDQNHIKYFEQVSEFESKRILAFKHADKIVSECKALASELGGERDLTSSLTTETTPIQAAYSALYKTFASGMKNLIREIEPERQSLVDIEKVWSKKHTDAKAARDGALDKLGEHKTATSQIIKLREEISNLINKIGELSAQIDSIGDPTENLNSSIDGLKKVVRIRADRTQEWAIEIQRLSQDKIKATVELEADVTVLSDAVNQLAAKTGSQEVTRTKELADALKNKSFWEVIDHLRTECLSLIYWKQVAASEGQDEPAATFLYSILGNTERIRSTLPDLLDISRIEGIATAYPKPEIQLSYCDGGKEISFEKASEGQRAGALLFMLLDQEGGPLLIDQPEGDLDNSIIAELTDVLHIAKTKRQIIFVSHNANIVVNGSSELVGHLEVTSSGERKFDHIGAIDHENIRDLITTTMEGGEKAFKDRQNKYGY